MGQQSAPPTGLLGKWHKISARVCDTPYPDEIEFIPGPEVRTGRYLGRVDQTAKRFIVWDAGTYRVEAPDHIAISTAWDELVLYTFSLADDTLMFTDHDGCRFTYRRVG